MVPRLSQPENVNVLISNTHWAWPQAVAEIFQPRGVNALMAQTPSEAVHLVDSSKIHLAILDTGQQDLFGMQALRMIRKHDQLLPCILISQQMDQHTLREALNLRVFSVVAKPVDLKLLAEQVDRLFVKYYNSDLFSHPDAASRQVSVYQKTVIQWSIRKQERSIDPHEDQTDR